MTGWQRFVTRLFGLEPIIAPVAPPVIVPVVETPAPVPQPVLIRCLDCQTDEPNFRMVEMTNHYLTADGKVKEEITGYRVACQKCPAVYAITHRGIWRPHPQSRPLTPEVPNPSSEFERPQQGQAPQPQGTPNTVPLTGRPKPRM